MEHFLQRFLYKLLAFIKTPTIILLDFLYLLSVSDACNPPITSRTSKNNLQFLKYVNAKLRLQLLKGRKKNYRLSTNKQSVYIPGSPNMQISCSTSYWLLVDFQREIPHLFLDRQATITEFFERVWCPCILGYD